MTIVGSLRRYRPVMVLALLLSITVSPVVFSKEGRWVFSTRDWVARAPAVIGDNVAGDNVYVRGGLENLIGSDNWLRYIKPLEGRDYLRFGFGVSYRDFLSANDLDALLLNARAEYWDTIENHPKWQWRFGLGYGYNLRDGENHYLRFCGDGALHYQENRENQSRIKLSYCSYDYNEDILVGFDQDRFGLLLAHRWRPKTDVRNELEGQVSMSVADADIESYGFARFGFKLKGATEISASTDVIGSLLLSQQSFAGPFSANLLEERRDSRYEVKAGFRYHQTNKLRFMTTIGWLSNASNVQERKFSGFTAWLGLEYRSNGYF